MMGRSGDRQVRRSWAQRGVIGVHLTAITAAVVLAGTLAYGNDRISQVTRVSIPELALVEGQEPTAELSATDPRNYLIVGVDDASGLPADDLVKIREEATLNTDTIMILRIDPGKTTADLLSIPRDLYLPISGTGSRARINSAFSTGGQNRLIRTIGDSFGIPIHHYVQIDFASFRTLVEVVDGIPVQFPRPTRARRSVELEIQEAGCWVLGPKMALGFARARKDYQVLGDDGDWHTDPGGGYSRVERQQLFLQLALRRAIAKGARNPNTLRRLIDLGAVSVTTDTQLSADELVDLGRAFRSFDPAELVSHTLPVDEAPSGGPAYQYLREEEAEPTLALFRGEQPEAPTDVAPDEVTVQVRNGTGTPNQATDVTRALAGIGFETVVPDADVEAGFPTVITYAKGTEGAARTLAAHVAGPVRYTTDVLPEGIDVVLVTGRDWLGPRVLAKPTSQVPGPTTTSAARPVATTPATTAVRGADTDADSIVAGPGPAGPDTPSTAVDAGSEAPDAASDDPDDPAYYRASAPAPDADCRPTK